MKHFAKWFLNLQRFGEGADGSAGADSGGTAPDAGEQNEELDFDALLASNPKYKEAHDQAIQKAIKGRFKANDQREAALAPLLQGIGQHYGVKPKEDGTYDAAELVSAWNGDLSRYEEEAMERGVSAEAIRQEHEDKAELERYRQQEARSKAEANRMAVIGRVDREIQEASAMFPGVNFVQELNSNQKFRNAVYSGTFTVEEAYRALYGRQITQSAMQAAAKGATEAAAATIASGKRRPVEGAAAGAPGASTSIDPTKLTKQQREDIRARVRRGEQITF